MKNDFKIIDEEYEAGNKAMRSYITGFVLSIILTLFPYFIVVNNTFGGANLVYAVVVFGLLQLFVQVVFFLHLHKKSRPHWNLAVFIFTLIIVFILVGGSLWVMNNLKYNMMNITPLNSNEGFIPK